MFLKRNRSRQGGRKYRSILLVQGKRVPAKRPPGRPRADAPPRRTVVVHETLANLSKLPPELVELIDAWCREQALEAAAAVHVGGADAEFLVCLNALLHEGGRFGFREILH